VSKRLADRAAAAERAKEMTAAQREAVRQALRDAGLDPDAVMGRSE
jgi:hypothetical protein